METVSLVFPTGCLGLAMTTAAPQDTPSKIENVLKLITNICLPFGTLLIGHYQHAVCQQSLVIPGGEFDT